MQQFSGKQKPIAYRVIGFFDDRKNIVRYNKTNNYRNEDEYEKRTDHRGNGSKNRFPQ